MRSSRNFKLTSKGQAVTFLEVSLNGSDTSADKINSKWFVLIDTCRDFDHCVHEFEWSESLQTNTSFATDIFFHYLVIFRKHNFCPPRNVQTFFLSVLITFNNLLLMLCDWRRLINAIQCFIGRKMWLLSLRQLRVTRMKDWHWCRE